MPRIKYTFDVKIKDTVAITARYFLFFQAFPRFVRYFYSIVRSRRVRKKNYVGRDEARARRSRVVFDNCESARAILNARLRSFARSLSARNSPDRIREQLPARLRASFARGDRARTVPLRAKIFRRAHLPQEFMTRKISFPPRENSLPPPISAIADSTRDSSLHARPLPAIPPSTLLPRPKPERISPLRRARK